MWVIHFWARCEDIQSQLASLATGDAACVVESALSVALLELCGYVQVEAVRVEVEAENYDGVKAGLRATSAADMASEHDVN